VWLLPVQPSWRQPVLLDHGRHAPAPSQVPSFAQSPLLAALFVQRDLGSAPPGSTLAQVPAGAVLLPLQVLQSPPVGASEHALLQQMPSVQKPLWHWLALVHAAPLTFNPQELLTQLAGGRQSAAWVAGVQLVLQTPWAQAKAPQDWLGGVMQVPLPSQMAAGVSAAEVAQTAAAQLSPAA
jgi:hypothetical protein